MPWRLSGWACPCSGPNMAFLRQLEVFETTPAIHVSVPTAFLRSYLKYCHCSGSEEILQRNTGDVTVLMFHWGCNSGVVTVVMFHWGCNSSDVLLWM